MGGSGDPLLLRRTTPRTSTPLSDIVKQLDRRKHLHVRIGTRPYSTGVFGSVARGEAGDASDIDLLVEFDRPVGLFHFVTVKERLESLLDLPVDLVTPRGLKAPLRDRVLAEARRVA